MDKLLPENTTNLTGITAVAAGWNHSLFLKNDSTVWACGENYSGQLGNGTTTQQNASVPVSGLSDITAVAAGWYHSLFLKSNGTVWACGQNVYGQLGNGTTTNQNVPVQVNGLSDITAVAAGNRHSLFLKNDGTVWACGQNFYGQLGNGNNIQQNLPVQVSGLSNITALAADDNHSLFLKNNDTVWACGYNYAGQLGNGNTTHQNAPVPVSGLSGITAVAAGRTHSLFLKNNGTVWACGENYFGGLGNGNKINQNIPVNIGAICPPPVPPTIDMSHFPTGVCLGSTINESPSISGSNPVFAMSVDNSINITNPKAIDKNNHAVYVLTDSDNLYSYDFNGNLLSSFPNLNISGIMSFTIDEADNVYLINGDGNVYQCDNTGTPLQTFGLTFFGGTGGQDMAFTTPVEPNLYNESVFWLDSAVARLSTLSALDTQFGYDNLYPSDSIDDYPAMATSLSIDNFYARKRVLITDPVNSTIWSRVLYPDGSMNFDYEEQYLLDPALTAGLELDFIASDSATKFITASSKNTGSLALISSERRTDGSIENTMSDITSLINPIQPVGIVTVNDSTGFKFWIADRGQNKLLRANLISYRIFPALPDGLRFNNLTGEIEGTPTTATGIQTYNVVITSDLGSDTSSFTFEVTPANGLNNSPGTGTDAAPVADGLSVNFIDFNNCEKLIEIADSIGGTSPGQTTVTQTVYPLVSVIANDSLIRRATQIQAQNIDTLKVNVTFYYTYQDIQLYKQTTGSTLSNDTTGGTMQIAVLQMHDLPNGGKEPIVHSPITANWSSTGHYWKAVVPVTKFSDFYAGDTTTLSNFNCSNTGDTSITVSNAYYVWNYDTLFTPGTHVDTLINQTGCDSVTTLHLTFLTTGISDAAVASGIHIFPNPSNGVFNIKFDNNTNGTKRVRVTNMLNTEVYNRVLTGSSSIDISNQSSGIYFISVETDNGTPVVWRVIKQ